jgi:hypothetical protein
MDIEIPDISADKTTTMCSVDSSVQLCMFDLPDELISGILHTLVDTVGTAKYSDGLRIILCLVCKKFYGAVFHYDLYWDSVYMYTAKYNCVNLMTDFGIKYNDRLEIIAAKNGSIDVIKLFGAYMTPAVVDKAAARGHLEVVQYWVAQGKLYNSANISEKAAAGGHRHILEWELANGYADHWDWCVATSAKSLDLMKWLIDHGCSHKHHILKEAIRRDDLEMIKYCIELEYPIAATSPPDWRYSNLNVVQWMHANDILEGYTASKRAAYDGNVHVIKWLKEVGLLDTDVAIKSAVGGAEAAVLRLLGHKPTECPDSWTITVNDNLPMLEYLWECGVGLPADTAELAAREYRWEVVSWAMSVGFPLTWRCVKPAIINPNTEFLSYALAAGYPKTTKLCTVAAKYGRNNLLKWLRDAGCPWDETACKKAVHRKHLRTLRLLHNNGCQCGHRALFKQ